MTYLPASLSSILCLAFLHNPNIAHIYLCVVFIVYHPILQSKLHEGKEGGGFAWFTALPTLPRTMPRTEQAWGFSLLKAPYYKGKRSNVLRVYLLCISITVTGQLRLRPGFNSLNCYLLAGWPRQVTCPLLASAFSPIQGVPGMKCKMLSQCLAPAKWQYMLVIQVVIPRDIPEMTKVPISWSTMKTAFKPFFTDEIMSVQRGIPLDREIQALA